MLHEIRYALRQLVTNPSFTAIAVITIAIGIAATTTMFSIVDAILIRPLPFPHAEQIVAVSQNVRSTGTASYDASPANFIDWSEQNNVFSAMAASRGWQPNLSGSGGPERIHGTIVSSQFFSLFGVEPILGRTFANTAPRVVVLSYAFWVQHYGADRKIIGRDVILDGEKYSIVGVMPPNFSPDQYGELWVPSPFDVPTHPLVPNADPRAFRDRNYLDVWARLKNGVTIEQARAEMSAIAQRLERAYPDANQDVGVALVPIRDQLVGNLRPMLLLLFSAVCLVLLIGCANVANLLLARAATRSREIAIRTALGASRARLIRQLLTESVILALLGGALGLLLATWALPLLVSLIPPEFAQFTGLAMNREMLGFALFTSVGTGILFGLAPALYATRREPQSALHEGERGSSLGRSSVRSILISGEIAFSVVLLVSAGLLLKSFARLMRVDPGFNPDHALVFNLSPPRSNELLSTTNFYQQVLDRLAALPGVESVGAVSRLPLAGGNSSRSFTVRGTPQDADVRVSTPNYFRAMGIPLLRGRNFNAHDTNTSTAIAIINQAAAETIFAGNNPIGQVVENFGPDNAKLEIVGVIGNVRHIGLEKTARPEIYLPLAQMQWPSMFFVLRSSVSNPMALLAAAKRAVWSVDPNVPLANPRTMQEVLAHSLLQRKFFMLLLSVFAAIATLLAAVGLYGVIAFSVAQRTREIGIRIALGGQRNDVLSLVLRQTGVLVAFGSIAGVALALIASRSLGRWLYGVNSTDLTTYCFVLVVLAVAAFLASITPALRAMRVNPIIALRAE